MPMTIPLVERLRASIRDIETGEPLDDDARPDLYVADIRELVERLFSPPEGVTLETTAEERATYHEDYVEDAFVARLVRDCDRQAAHITTLTAAVTTEKERADAAELEAAEVETIAAGRVTDAEDRLCALRNMVGHAVDSLKRRVDDDRYMDSNGQPIVNIWEVLPLFTDAIAASQDATARRGMTLDAISASNIRHVVEGAGKIARAALGGETP